MGERQVNSMDLNAAEQRLIDRFQHGIPLAARPFFFMAEQIGCDEADVIAMIERLTSRGVVSRVGPVFRPHRVGTSTLAAMDVPPGRLEAVAELVNSYPEVNHNYEREHRFNLWFVVTAPDEAHLAAVLADMEAKSGLRVMSLPMLEAYHIDLGFSLADTRPHQSEGWMVRPAPVVEPVRRPLSIRDSDDLRLIAAIQDGLPLVSRPFAAIAQAAGSTETQVCKRLDDWMHDGTIGRFGIVVRHRELGYRANAMVVWNVPDEDVGQWGRCFSRYDFVTLCYQRRRHLPQWDYNLFCMIHGRDRSAVEERVRLLVEQCGVAQLPHAVLFSRRRFKQRGARYVSPQPQPTTAAREEVAHG